MYDVLKTHIMWTLVHQPQYWQPANPKIRPSTRQCHDGYNTWRVRWLSWAEGRCCVHVGRTPDGGGGRVNHHHIRCINCVGRQEYGVVCGCPHINVPRGTIGRALLGWFSSIGRCRSVEEAYPSPWLPSILLVAYVWACVENGFTGQLFGQMGLIRSRLFNFFQVSGLSMVYLEWFWCRR